MRVALLVSLVACVSAFAPAGRGGHGTALLAGFGAPKVNKPPPVEKKYSKAALEKSYEQFEKVKGSKGSHLVDIYVGKPEGSKFFFLGKCAHDLKTPPECALAALRYLLVPHACFLQPLLTASSEKLVFGIAKGNSELEVAKGEAPITTIEMGKAKLSHKPGFSPEWYEDGEEGFYVRRE